MATAALDRPVLKGAAKGGARGRGSAGRAGDGAEDRPLERDVDWKALSDAEIMLRVSAGDDSGFSYLIEKYRRPIVSFMFRMVHNQAVAEELAQEVFLRVYRSRQTYRAEARFSTWLYRIATNLGVNYARDTKTERSAPTVYLDQPDPETGTLPDVADSRPGAEADMVRDERMRAIREHVMALPERQRTAVLMHKYQGLDYKEIGSVLRLSESATKSLLFRAYQTLRERLKGFVEEN
ncbi:MAG: RNA polymerase sigma factor [Acidobacteriota bacterium]